MIYPTMIKFKEHLTEKLGLPVWLTVPSKTKKPYLTLGFDAILIGGGPFSNRVTFDLHLTLWVDKQREESASDVIQRLQQLKFPLVYSMAEGQASIQRRPALTLSLEKTSIGYSMSFKVTGSYQVQQRHEDQ